MWTGKGEWGEDVIDRTGDICQGIEKLRLEGNLKGRERFGDGGRNERRWKV